MTSQILKKQNTWRTKGPFQYHKIPNINHELRQERMKLIAGFILSWLRIFPYYFKALFEEGGGGGGLTFARGRADNISEFYRSQ